MHGNDLEKAFGDFLESEVYERGESAQFTFARESFIAGWRAARRVKLEKEAASEEPADELL